MTMSDPIADMLTRIRNANTAKHDTVDVPASKMKIAIANILLDEGYIAKYDLVEDGHFQTIHITLKYGADKNEKVISGLKRISKPGLRVYASTEDLPKVLGGLGTAIISTNKDNKESAYGSPAFYQDCSNPISLGYINKDLTTGLSVDSGSSVSLDGKILSLANVTLKDLVFTMSFDIHIINNKNEEFVCYINKPILSEEENNSIFNGYIATQFSPSPGTYQFIRKE